MLNQNHLLLLLGLAGSCINDISMTTSDTPVSEVSSSPTTGKPTSAGAASADAPCPDGDGRIDEGYTIVGDRSNFTGFVWVRPSDGQYVVTCNPNCSSLKGYSATSNVNVTHSTLTIENVTIKDAGTWEIADATVADGHVEDVCKLIVAKPPECTVTSDGDINELELDTTLLLTVHLNEYYCSEEAGLNLTTGAVVETFKMNYNVIDVTSEVINKTISINLSTLGDVRVRFMCDATSYSLSCRGVQRLLKSPPQCNISSDRGTNALELGTNLTLTLELRGYYCSQQAGFELTTGDVTDVLLQNQTTNNITGTVLHHSFNVTADRLGDVSVTFRCDNINRTLTVVGVFKLTAATATTPGSTETSTDRSNSTMQTSSPLSTPSPSPSQTPSEESTTRKSASSTTESSPTDLTLGLYIGIPVLVFVILLIISVSIFQRGQLKKIRKYIVSGRHCSGDTKNEFRVFNASTTNPDEYKLD